MKAQQIKVSVKDWVKKPLHFLLTKEGDRMYLEVGLGKDPDEYRYLLYVTDMGMVYFSPATVEALGLTLMNNDELQAEITKLKEQRNHWRKLATDYQEEMEVLRR